MIRPIYVITTIFFAHSMISCMEPVDGPIAIQASAPVAVPAPNPLGLSMTKIRHWSAVGSFRKCLVAYTSKSNYLRPQAGYFSAPDQKIEFGLIVDEPAKKWDISGQQFSGHVMKRLIKAGAVARMCALTGNQLDDQADLLMRDATGDEIAGVRKVVESGQAEFENTSKKDALTFLDRYQLELNDRLQPRKCLDCCSVQ
jgi:hypothetical protein